MDVSAVILTLTNTLLSAVLCFITYRIGVMTGFIRLWKIILSGFALGALARLLITFGEADYTVIAFDLKTAGLLLVAVSRVLLLIGFYLFFLECRHFGKGGGNNNDS